MSNPNEVKHVHKFYQKDDRFMECKDCEMEVSGDFYVNDYLPLVEKCKNLDSIIGSLDVKDPNACDALLNVQLINQNTIKELKTKLEAAVKMLALKIKENGEIEAERTALIKAEEQWNENYKDLELENKRLREALGRIQIYPYEYGAEASSMRTIAEQALGGKE